MRIVSDFVLYSGKIFQLWMLTNDSFPFGTIYPPRFSTRGIWEQDHMHSLQAKDLIPRIEAISKIDGNTWNIEIQLLKSNNKEAFTFIDSFSNYSDVSVNLVSQQGYFPTTLDHMDCVENPVGK